MLRPRRRQWAAASPCTQLLSSFFSRICSLEVAVEASPDLRVREGWGSGTVGDGSALTTEGQLVGFPTVADPVA